MRRSLAITACLFCCGIALAADNAVIPEAASTIGAAQTVTAQHFMAATANPLATRAAVDILRRGGSAVDAAIAAQLVLGLVEPQSSGIGGGAFMLFWDNRSQQLRTYDGRETAPATVDDSYFLQPNGQPQEFLDAVIGGRSVGAPGVVKLLALSHQRHGNLPWRDLFAPAIHLAEQGFAISPRLNTLLHETPRLAVNPAIRDYFFLPDGNPKPIGFILKNPAYAKTLRLLAQKGQDAFYRGAIARDVVQTVQHNANQPGSLALADLAAYRAKERTPVCGAYRVYLVCGPPPPSSGGTTVLAIIGMLQRFSAEQLRPGTVGFYHLFAEASRLAFADRNTYIADPDFVPVPTAGLIAPDYLAQRAALIDPARASTEVSAGQPAWPQNSARIDYRASQSPELVSTSHLSIVDALGNALSMTTSVEDAFGSRQWVDGFLLNNQLTDFSFAPRTAEGKLIANRIEPGKRPRSSMAPLIVFRDGKPILLLGSPGGARIIDYVAKTLLPILDQQLPLGEAIASPHVVAMSQKVELEQGRFGDGEKTALQALGHPLTEISQTSGLNAILIENGSLQGSTDPRREGAVAGN